MSIGLSVCLCTISMGNIQRGICWVLWIHTNNSYDKSQVRILLGLFYFYFFFGQMLWNLKLLKQRKYFDYCDLLFTWMLTGVLYHLNCQSVIYSTYTLTSVDNNWVFKKACIAIAFVLHVCTVVNLQGIEQDRLYYILSKVFFIHQKFN